MYFEKETKERFAKMLLDGQILVIRSTNPRSRIFRYKFIGANDDGKWDFTPLVADLSKRQTNNSEDIREMSVRAKDGVSVVSEAVQALEYEGFMELNYLNSDELYFKLREQLTFFYI